uniref:uncharacterized protein LOC120329440 isoform X1 n=1 Tax=Styela clava TaxID=7725 RepID=UPI00193A78E5|nr:uncharacterized protein LOC120329440 isoform X1 [Styela clava]
MTSPIVSLVLFLSLSILTNGRRHEKICLQLESVEDVYGENRAEVQTIPGKKGPKGDRGFPGLKGSQAEVDYDKLGALINEKVKKAMKKQRAEMNETINELLERIEELEGQESTNTFEDATTAPSVPPTLSPPPGFTEQDIVRYDERIFIPLDEYGFKASAIAKCQQLGGELANIYNQIHMDKIITFIRDNKLDGKSYKAFHLGMTYDPIDQILRLQNGTVTSHSGFKWYPDSPFDGQSYSGFTNMIIGIHEDSTSRYQYILNHPDYSRYVLCEV